MKACADSLAEYPGAERAPRRRRDPLPRPLRHRRRGPDRRRARRPGRPRRGREVRRRARHRDRRPRRARAVGLARGRRAARLDVHGHERGQARRALPDADRQPPGGRDPERRSRGAEAGRRGTTRSSSDASEPSRSRSTTVSWTARAQPPSGWRSSPASRARGSSLSTLLRVGSWYTIGLCLGLGLGLSIAITGILGTNVLGIGAAAVVGAVLGGAIGLLIGDSAETVAGAVGGVLGALVGGGRRRRRTPSRCDPLRRRGVHGSARRAGLPRRAHPDRRVRPGGRAPGPRRPDARASGRALRRAAYARQVTLVRRRRRRACGDGRAAAPPPWHHGRARARRDGARAAGALRAGGSPRATPTTTARFRSASGQTISQPFVVATICSLLDLDGTERVLDVGTGSGLPGRRARGARGRRGDHRACSGARRGGPSPPSRTPASRTSRCGSATAHSASPSTRPSARIAVAAAAPRVPRALYDAARPRGGRLVLPRGSRRGQDLVLVVRTPTGPVERTSISCRFVPLVGDEGFGDD